MKIRAKLLIPLERVYFLPWRVKPRFMKTNAGIDRARTQLRQPQCNQRMLMKDKLRAVGLNELLGFCPYHPTLLSGFFFSNIHCHSPYDETRRPSSVFLSALATYSPAKKHSSCAIVFSCVHRILTVRASINAARSFSAFVR